LERDATVGAVPLLSLAAPLIGHFQIRNRGTVGGSIAHADAAGELPAVALALDSELDVAGSGGTRTVPAREFFLGTFTTALADEELLTAIRFPVWPERSGFAIREVARRHGDFALTGAVCGVTLGADDKVERAAIALLGMGNKPERALDAEQALVGSAPPEGDALDEIGRLAVRDTDPPDDIHASASYRHSVGAHVVKQALTAAVDEARA
jgi:aerobic carbon-monoxide dehydrogenase medium subunit